MNTTDPTADGSAESVTTLELSTDASDPVACACSVEPGTGHTRYQLTGKRLHGVVTVIPAYSSAYVDPFTTRVMLLLGDCATDHAHHATRHAREHEHLLTVNGVELTGAPVVDLANLSRVAAYSGMPADLVQVGATLLRSDGAYAPARTRERTVALFAAILDHWRTDPANQTVRETAARHAVRTGDYLATKALMMSETRRQLAELQAKFDRHAIEHKRMQLLCDSTDPDTADPIRRPDANVHVRCSRAGGNPAPEHPHQHQTERNCDHHAQQPVQWPALWPAR